MTKWDSNYKIHKYIQKSTVLTIRVTTENVVFRSKYEFGYFIDCPNCCSLKFMCIQDTSKRQCHMRLSTQTPQSCRPVLKSPLIDIHWWGS